ncbi:MAG: penicillin-binding protein [Clostridiales bacterium]|nr:penicillin-binding protein [Clostridiales bacterium]MDN5280855.1 penicillin-binding protein [Candidatus Ozemobacter sp.]
MKKLVLKAALISTICLLGIWLIRIAWLPLIAIDPTPLIQNRFSSGGTLVDRNENLLRLFPDQNGDYSCYLSLASHSQEIISALLTAEDRNFYSHPGFDPVAISRALIQNISSMKIVSGASTISQQLIRILKPRPRTLSTKISELLAALWLEEKFSKKQILEFYLNSVPMFGNIRGFYLASLLLFKKSPDLLNLGEAATLAAIVQSPGRLSPFNPKSNRLLRKRRDWIIREMLKLGLCTIDEANNAFKLNIPEYRSQMPFNAPHFCDLYQKVRGAPKGKKKTTISLPLQNLLYQTLRSHLPRIAKYGARQTCGLILSAENLEILAMVGSSEFGPIAGGFNNGCVAKRSGGSILKPFLYALALDRGFYPSYVIPDTMQPFKTPQGEYLAYNADRKSYGPVTIRNALGNSLNISAVKMLNQVGISDFYGLLVDLELLPAQKGAADYYGLGLAIGNPELRMLDVARAYSVFANKGRLKSLSFLLQDKTEEKQIISAQSAFLIFDILADPSARLFTFGTPSFFKFSQRWGLKTGTSTNYRDSWLIALNGNYIIALWVGNFDGSPTRSLSGASACGPIARNIIDNLEKGATERIITCPPGIQKVKICSISGQRPGKFCPNIGYDLFEGNADELLPCQFHQSATATHELAPDYARWIQNRARQNNSDPFRLRGNPEIQDPYQIAGIYQEEDASASETSRLVAGGALPDAVWNDIRIISPHDGDRFVMRSTNENFLHLRAIPAAPVSELIWLINGREFIRTAPPFEAYWPMRAGKHRITAISEGEAAAEVTVYIEN